MVTVSTDSGPDGPNPQPATIAVIGYAVVSVEAAKLTIDNELMTLNVARRLVESLDEETRLRSIILPVYITLDSHEVFSQTIAKLDERAADIRNKVETMIRESN